MNTNSKEAILAAARHSAQSHGYGGLNFRDLADEVGIKAASIYHHFPSKADLGASVARRYWEDTAADLEAIEAATSDPRSCLRQYPQIFRRSLESQNRLCLGSFMSAEYDDLPEPVRSGPTFRERRLAPRSQNPTSALVDPRARVVGSSMHTEYTGSTGQAG